MISWTLFMIGRQFVVLNKTTSPKKRKETNSFRRSELDPRGTPQRAKEL
jgi:hypothetical protein